MREEKMCEYSDYNFWNQSSSPAPVAGRMMPCVWSSHCACKTRQLLEKEKENDNLTRMTKSESITLTHALPFFLYSTYIFGCLLKSSYFHT